MTKGLTKTFNLEESDDPMLHELEALYSFSDNPDLDEISLLALNAYKSQMMDIMNVEPKYRSKLLEVAQSYLNLAKDALAKNEDLRIKANKQIKEPKTEEGEGASTHGMTRNEILNEVDKGNKLKAVK